MQFTKSLIPRQIRRSVDPQPGSRVPVESGLLAGRHVLVVIERSAQDQGEPTPAAIIDGLRSSGVRVSVLDCYSTLADLVGHRVIGRPDLVIGMLPGRGPALAAVRAAERIGAPLVALVSHDAPPSWGEGSTLRRAARVVITDEELRDRVERAGARADRIDVWHSFVPGALRGFEALAHQTISASS